VSIHPNSLRCLADVAFLSLAIGRPEIRAYVMNTLEERMRKESK